MGDTDSVGSMVCARIDIDAERCKGCGLCKEFCPRGIITLAEYFNHMGYHPAVVTDPKRCTGCAACAWMCPDVAIEVYK